MPPAAATAHGAHELDAFVRAHGPGVLRLARAIVGSAATAEDVYQETFLAAYRALPALREAASARAWLFAIARREAWRSARAEARLVPREEPLVELGLAAGWGQPTPEDLAVRLESSAHLEAALGQLDAEEREVIALRDGEGLGGLETAELLGLSLSAMKSRLHRARLRLLAALTHGQAPRAPAGRPAAATARADGRGGVA